MHPNPHRGAALKAVPRAPGTQVGLLDEIFGLVDRAEHAVAVRTQFGAVRLGGRDERRVAHHPISGPTHVPSLAIAASAWLLWPASNWKLCCWPSTMSSSTVTPACCACAAIRLASSSSISAPPACTYIGGIPVRSANAGLASGSSRPPSGPRYIAARPCRSIGIWPPKSTSLAWLVFIES